MENTQLGLRLNKSDLSTAKPFPPRRNYTSLSVADLLEARDAYHVYFQVWRMWSPRPLGAVAFRGKIGPLLTRQTSAAPQSNWENLFLDCVGLCQPPRMIKSLVRDPAQPVTQFGVRGCGPSKPLKAQSINR